jgi:hypothetical protein
MLGMVIGAGILFWTLGELGVAIFAKFGAEERRADVVGRVVKRALESPHVLQARSTSLLNPIVSRSLLSNIWSFSSNPN